MKFVVLLKLISIVKCSFFKNLCCIARQDEEGIINSRQRSEERATVPITNIDGGNFLQVQTADQNQSYKKIENNEFSESQGTDEIDTKNENPRDYVSPNFLPSNPINHTAEFKEQEKDEKKIVENKE